MKTKDFLVEYKGIEEDAHNMHLDNEVQSARANCYHAAKSAIELHKRLADVNKEGGIEPWVMEKLTIATDYLKTLNEYFEEQDVETCDFELVEPDFESGFAKHLDSREPDVMLYENMSIEEALRDIERRMFEWNKRFLEAKKFDDYDEKIEARKMLLKLAKLRVIYQKKSEAEQNQDTTLRPVSPMVKVAEDKKLDNNKKVKEVSPPGWGKTVEKMKKHKDIDNPFALAWSMHKKGAKPHNETEEVKEEASAGASSASAMSAVSTTLGDTIRRPKMSKPKFKNAVKSSTPKVGKGIY